MATKPWIEQIGWAYWLDDHWHMCADEPVAHEKRKPVWVFNSESEMEDARC